MYLPDIWISWYHCCTSNFLNNHNQSINSNLWNIRIDWDMENFRCRLYWARALGLCVEVHRIVEKNFCLNLCLFRNLMDSDRLFAIRPDRWSCIICPAISQIWLISRFSGRYFCTGVFHFWMPVSSADDSPGKELELEFGIFFQRRSEKFYHKMLGHCRWCQMMFSIFCIVWIEWLFLPLCIQHN